MITSVFNNDTFFWSCRTLPQKQMLKQVWQIIIVISFCLKQTFKSKNEGNTELK